MAPTVDQIIIDRSTSGVVTRHDLIASGVSPSSIDRRRRQRRLDAVGDGVYLVPQLVDASSALVAGLLALPGSAISRTSAGRRLGFNGLSGGDHVTVLHGQRRPVRGVIVHETRRWLSGDIIDVDGHPTTSPSRTIIDLAAELSVLRLRHLVETQLVKQAPAAADLAATFTAHRRRGRTGTAKLDAVLDELLNDDPMPASALEHLVWDALQQRGVRGFRRQYRPPWYDGQRGIVDFAHPRARLVLEADGRRWHSVTQAQNDDRRRDRQAVGAGWAVLRVGWAEITRRRDDVIDEIISVLEGRLASLLEQP